MNPGGGATTLCAFTLVALLGAGCDSGDDGNDMESSGIRSDSGDVLRCVLRSGGQLSNTFRSSEMVGIDCSVVNTQSVPWRVDLEVWGYASSSTATPDSPLYVLKEMSVRAAGTKQVFLQRRGPRDYVGTGVVRVRLRYAELDRDDVGHDPLPVRFVRP